MAKVASVVEPCTQVYGLMADGKGGFSGGTVYSGLNMLEMEDKEDIGQSGSVGGFSGGYYSGTYSGRNMLETEDKEDMARSQYVGNGGQERHGQCGSVGGFSGGYYSGTYSGRNMLETEDKEDSGQSGSVGGFSGGYNSGTYSGRNMLETEDKEDIGQVATCWKRRTRRTLAWLVPDSVLGSDGKGGFSGGFICLGQNVLESEEKEDIGLVGAPRGVGE
eukprot:gene20886-27731_t